LRHFITRGPVYSETVMMKPISYRKRPNTSDIGQAARRALPGMAGWEVTLAQSLKRDPFDCYSLGRRTSTDAPARHDA
jgi:hypothetical protein